ncbi:MAG: lipid-A-disaccharide synthase [Rickettsiaceae bacterium]
MKLYIIAGENSGDFIGGKLIRSLRNVFAGDKPEIKGIGGAAMQAEGLTSLFAISQINLMGFFEVLPHIFRINKLINKTVEDILAQDPDVLITIDSPGFTYRVAAKVRALAPHIKLVHMVAPSVWAYKPSRAQKYAKLYDHLFVLLPFEPQYFTVHGLPTTYIGHPVLEQEFYQDSKELRSKLGIKENIKAIAVTPGSRAGEIARHMPIIRKILDELSSTRDIKAIFIQPDEKHIQNILKYLSGARFDFSFSTKRLEAFAASDCALAKSGTNTLEIAASGTPMVIGYKLNPLTFFFLKMMLKVKYACLINIIADREVIPEYIQSDFSSENITTALSDLINSGKKSSSQVAQAKRVLSTMGLGTSQQPSEVAARKIIEIAR